MKHDQQSQQRRPGSTTTIDFTARGNARTYRLIVTVPHTAPPPQGYPVLVVLDGNVCQPIFAAAVTCLALGGEIDPPLVVGIGYPEQEIEVWAARRRLDFTPGPPELDLLPPGSPSGYGGIEGFLDLIEFDAATIVRKRWPVDATRSALFGHSHGGLATLHALFTRPTLFRNWIAVSPSIWFARHALRVKEAVFARQVEHFEIMPRVHISVGSRESEVPAHRPHGASIGPGEVERQIKAARMVSNARQLALRLKLLKGGPGYELHYELLRGETHSSAPFAMVCDALQMAFAEVPKN